MKGSLPAAVFFSVAHLGFELSCRGWSGARILSNPVLNGSRFFIRDPGHHKMNVMIRLRATHTESGRSSMLQTWPMTMTSPPNAPGTRGTGPRGYRRVAASEAVQDFSSMFPHQHSVATQSSALCMSPQMLDAILRSSDASAFSTEDLTRLQAGICQESHQHQPVRTSRGVKPPESIGVADPYLPASQPSSSATKEKPIFELVAE